MVDLMSAKNVVRPPLGNYEKWVRLVNLLFHMKFERLILDLLVVEIERQAQFWLPLVKCFFHFSMQHLNL